MVDRLMNSEVNRRRVAAVDTAFGSAGRPLAAPMRVLVGEGVLVKICRKKPKARQFFLFNDCLVYGNILISKKRYNKQRIYQLDGVRLVDIPDDAECGLRHGWEIRTPSRSFAVYAATATEKSEWMRHIERCVSDLAAKNPQKPAAQTAAVWVPDAEASRCMRCTKTRFNLIQRRHHCRACGSVVCRACSQHSFRIPALDANKAVRVCAQCYLELSSGRTNPSSVPANILVETATTNAISSVGTSTTNGGENSNISTPLDEGDTRSAGSGVLSGSSDDDEEEEDGVTNKVNNNTSNMIADEHSTFFRAQNAATSAVTEG